MLVKLEQLGQRLKKNSPPLIMISGAETLLVQEACDQVRKYAREQGYSEREIIDAGGCA
jgi:DNA polymerase III subunit delta